MNPLWYSEGDSHGYGCGPEGFEAFLVLDVGSKSKVKDTLRFWNLV